VSDTASVLHDLDDGPTYDSSHTGTSEYRVRCGCGHVAWGPSKPAAVAGHNRHRADQATQLRLALSLLGTAIGRGEAA
jgi:hypothetical protein